MGDDYDDDFFIHDYYMAGCYDEEYEDDFYDYDVLGGSSVTYDTNALYRDAGIDSDSPTTDDEEYEITVCRSVTYDIAHHKMMRGEYRYTRNRKNEYIADNDAKMLGEAISGNTTLSTFGLKGFLFTSKGFKFLMDGMAKNKSLHRFRFRGRPGGNEVIEIGLLQILATMLKENAFHFKDLDLSRSKMGWIGMITILESLLSNTVLTSLDMDRIIVRDSPTGYPLDMKTPHPTSSDVNTTPSLRLAAGMVAKILQCNNTLTSLELAFNPLGDEFVVIVADALRANKCTLSRLCIRAIDMTDIGVIALANALKYNSVIGELVMDKNNFSGAGVIAMGEALKYNKSLTYLYMNDHLFRNNRELALRPQDIDYSYLATLFEALEYNSTLQCLEVFEPCLDYERYMPEDIQQRILNSLDYNDTVQSVYRGMKSAPRAIRRKIEEAEKGKRIAPKKGAHERRAIYNLLLRNCSVYG